MVQAFCCLTRNCEYTRRIACNDTQKWNDEYEARSDTFVYKLEYYYLLASHATQQQLPNTLLQARLSFQKV